MALKNGEVIEFDYELWVEGHEGLYDTTMREVAESGGILNPEAHYGPVVYVIGSGRIIRGLDQALRNAPIGKSQEIDLAPEDAYGPRDAKKIETIPIHEFRKHDVDPQVGLTIRYNNRAGVVMTVGGGRVRVDFNPALAGKRLKYRFTVRKVAESDEERIVGLIRMNFPANLEWKTSVAKQATQRVATIEVPEGVGHHPAWVEAKLRCVLDIARYLELDQVRFVEPYTLPKRTAQEPEGVPQAAGAERAGA